MCALAAIELNLSELHGIEGWWGSVGPGRRHELLEFQGRVRAYQRELQNPSRPTLDGAVDRDCGQALGAYRWPD
jgi:hypothetical protein